MSAETYLALKLLHRSCALLSISGFVLRWGARLAGQAWASGRLARTLPHSVDTLLLASALAMAVAAGLNPIHVPWLATKIVALLAYIGLGMLALSPRRSPRVRIVAGAAAVLVFAHIVAVALTKQATGVF